MNPVSIVTIKSKIPLYKGEEAANAIELIELEEVGFELISQVCNGNKKQTHRYRFQFK